MPTEELELLEKGHFDLIKADIPPPDPKDTRYVRHGAETIGVKELNGFERPVRRVTVSGMHLVFDEDDASGFKQLYNGKDDIAEVEIYADQVTIKTDLHFPQSNVLVCCRELNFDGACPKFR